MPAKTTARTPQAYIDSLAEPRRREIQALFDLIRKAAPKLAPFVYGSMLGFGPYHYKYASGHEGDGAWIALASQKSYISLYVGSCDGQSDLTARCAGRLPKANIGKCCVRFKRLGDVDVAVLRELVAASGDLYPKQKT